MLVINKFIKILGLKKANNLNGYLIIEGWLTPNEANGLFQIAQKLSKKSVVLEIGSWKGKSTWCISQGLRNGTINCIDPFNAAGEEGSKEIYEKTKGEKNLQEQFEANLKNVPSSVKIKTLKGYSSEFVGAIKNIDLLFIDGDHSIEGCRFDFEHYEKELKIGGYLAFHDYYPGRADLGPVWVIDNLVKNDSSYQFYRSYDSLYVFQKKA